ncbi:NAD(P)-dependent alcohol dehydrogenase [Umezawaea tangerina]|uniref:NADPH:quinone reductase-like Zn-dependent oxidoreductase n=1 Tax=Umezawaea tangerina TaxID=84725 RepID=A0A2T0T4V3_9PSEU|nr:NAD(P)-dependent alcohol dehydrogenase [Umezawaea tangerina]PRY40692.1 NADPH:quinone reductase-like Zn-dependent oxidoreductase [Umezawaea tangerina]
MKAIVRDVYGSADVLELVDVDRPVAGDGEVLVRVRAAGVDPGVWHLMTGLPYPVRLVTGLRVPKDRSLGLDVAGVVEEVGPGVSRFAVGDEVFGTCGGSFAEYAVGAEDAFVAKPADLTFEQAAAVPVSACTALQGLRDTGRVRAGQDVLVIGAGGGVGAYAVQLAKAFGARVTGVCGPAKVDLVRSLGADAVVDYTREDLADGTRYDLVLDTAGNRTLAHLRRALTPKGTLVIVGGEEEGRLLRGMDRQLRGMVLSLVVGQRIRTFVASQPRADLELLRGHLEAGTVRPVIDRTYPLSATADAVRYLAQGHPTGKVVITV